MKYKKLFLLVSVLALTGCNNVSVPDKEKTEISDLQKAIINLRSGFHMSGIKEQICLSSENEELFRNKFKYDYSFENSNEEIATNQKYTFTYAGKEQDIEISVVRDPDGFAAQRYVNYKNEIGFYRISDNGYYSYYDDYFMNPFLLIEETDLTKTKEENGEVIYSLFKDKLDLFDYYLTGNSFPLQSVELTFKDNVLTSAKTVSSKFTGSTKDTSTGFYIPCSWTYVANLSFENIGKTVIEGPKKSEEPKIEKLDKLFSSVKDNFTLEATMSLKGESAPLNSKTSYFDGSSYYIEMDKEDKTKDYLYHEDPFKKDGLLYEYKFNSDSKLWEKSSNSSYSSYNIDPHDKSIFVPHLKDMSSSLFFKQADEDGYFWCNNDYAQAFIGEGFFSDGELLSYFSEGYVTEAKLKEDNGDIIVSLDFYFPYDSSTILEMTYTAKYSHIGTTKIPDVDL